MNWKKFLKNITYKLKRIWHTIESCYLCSRFVFLYPRNRWTGTHWHSWKIREYLYGCPAQTTWKHGEKIQIPATTGIHGKAFEQVPKPNRQYDFETIDKVKSYPWAIWYYIVLFLYKYFLPIFHCIPTYTELDDMEPGWRKAFGIQMCKELKTQLKKEHYLYKYRITQIKEKWGYLHWYDEGHSDEVHKILHKYEEISWNTCIMCGKPATKITAGWISPYCDDCFPKDHLAYEEKMPDGTWQETEEYRKRMEEV